MKGGYRSSRYNDNYGKNRKYEKQVQQKKLKCCLYGIYLIVLLVVLILINLQVKFVTLPSALSSVIFSPLGANKYEKNVNMNTHVNNDLQGSSIKESQNVAKPHVRGSKNAVVDQLIKMQEQQTNKFNFRLKNLESSVREITLENTKQKKTIEELQNKLKKHDMTLARLNTNVVTRGSNNNNERLLGNSNSEAAHGDIAAAVDPKQEFSSKQLEVIEATKHSWKAYKKYGFGHDEILPISKTYHTWFNIGLTLVDSLDTLLLMKLETEYEEAREWVANKLNFDTNQDVNLFECTIRELGGLLSAYTLTKDQLYLEKATDLGKRLLPAFNSKSGIPFSDVNLKTHKAHAPKWGSDSSLAEVTTIQLEFEYLAHLSGNIEFKKVVTRVNEIIAEKAEKTKIPHLLPIFINANTAALSNSARISLGARGDSYYEYLLKQWLLSGKTDEKMRQRYNGALEAIEKNLVRRSKPNNYLFIAEKNSGGGGNLINKMDHLVCFMPGLIALGAINGAHKENGKGGPDLKRLQLAKDLLETCLLMYESHPTGLAPEIAFFNTDDGNPNDMRVKQADSHNLLRPETIESLFILYRITKDKQYRTRGYKIFKNFIKHCKIADGGFSSIKSVLAVPVQYKDKMESFWIAETLKYFFLLFDETETMVDLNSFVLTTEAHIFPILKQDDVM
jgi:endoplasmic reticulum Man9GlcNAc2 1,2-alpha-mannosidase